MKCVYQLSIAEPRAKELANEMTNEPADLRLLDYVFRSLGMDMFDSCKDCVEEELENEMY